MVKSLENHSQNLSKSLRKANNSNKDNKVQRSRSCVTPTAKPEKRTLVGRSKTNLEVIPSASTAINVMEYIDEDQDDEDGTTLFPHKVFTV